MIFFPVLLSSLLLFTIGCSGDAPGGGSNNSQQTDPDWLVPQDQVLDGGVGKDGIPSVDNPRFTTASEIDYLIDVNLVLAIKVGDVIKAYPHNILDWHEIVNDNVSGLNVALTYCPLTGTGIGWNREINGSITSFGVSGLLYNTNLMPYDRQTNSTWSQQSLLCVNGQLKAAKSENISFIETDWKTWQTAYPNSLVQNTVTGFTRDYRRYPYGPYKTNHNMLLFPINTEDDRLPRKERVLGVFVNEEPVAFTFNQSGNGLEVHNRNVNKKNITIATSSDHNIIVAFENEEEVEFTPVQGELPIIMEDGQGNRYDLFGEVLEGHARGTRLIIPTQFIGYWFSWGAFYPDLELVELK